MRIQSRIVGVLGLTFYTLIGLASTGWPAKEEVTGRFQQFEISPKRICINREGTTIRIIWRVIGKGETCFSNLKMNGVSVHGDIWDENISGSRCGEGDYSRETTFDLTEVFQDNIPSSITVTAELTMKDQVSGDELLDTESVTISTETQCN